MIKEKIKRYFQDMRVEWHNMDKRKAVIHAVLTVSGLALAIATYFLMLTSPFNIMIIFMISWILGTVCFVFAILYGIEHDEL